MQQRANASHFDPPREATLLRRLLECTRLLSSTLDLRELTNTVLNIVREETGFQRGTVFVIDQENQQLRSFLAQGVENFEISLPIGSGIAGSVALNGKVLDVPAVHSDSRFHAKFDNVLKFKTADVYCLPIFDTHENCIGVLQLLNRQRPITNEDKKFLSSLSLELGRALENGLTYHKLKESHQAELALTADLKKTNDELRDLAFEDGLTGLKNHRYWQEAIVHEVARAERYKRPLSLILLDIDCFKRINDTHGHLRGDIVLRGISQAMKRTSRNSDVIARYGGDEFAVVAPETNVAGAKRKGQLLRAAIEKLKIDADGVIVRVTISVGIAVYHPLKPMSANELIAAADRVLYKSKKNGKNRVTLWQS